MRWVEEKNLTTKEMEWTVNYYQYMATVWGRRRDQQPVSSEGHVAYAAKKVHMWGELANVAQAHFEKLKR